MAARRGKRDQRPQHWKEIEESLIVHGTQEGGPVDKPNTMKGYRNAAWWLDGVDPRTLTQQQLGYVRQDIVKRYSSLRTARQVCMSLKAILVNVYGRRDLVLRRPKHKPSSPIAPPIGVIRQVFAEARRIDPGLEAAFQLIYLLLTRPGEVCALELGNAHPESGAAEILRSKTGDQHANIAEPAKAFIADWMARRPLTKCPSLVVDRAGQPFTVRRLEDAMRKIVERLGTSYRITPNILRAAAATHLAAKRTPLDAIQMQMRHAKIATTWIYAHRQMDDDKKAHIDAGFAAILGPPGPEDVETRRKRVAAAYHKGEMGFDVFIASMQALADVDKEKKADRLREAVEANA